MGEWYGLVTMKRSDPPGEWGLEFVRGMCDPLFEIIDHYWDGHPLVISNDQALIVSRRQNLIVLPLSFTFSPL